jgi:DNA-binding NarL/FixJ family response regulator
MRTNLATIRVVLADDNAEVLTDIREELDNEFRIVGVATNGEEAIREVLRHDPDVIVLDVTMPLLTGLQVASRLREIHTRTKILLLTIHEEQEYVSAGLATGALGFVTKRRLSSDLPRAIREVFDGRTFLSPSLKR